MEYFKSSEITIVHSPVLFIDIKNIFGKDAYEAKIGKVVNQVSSGRRRSRLEIIPIDQDVTSD